MKPVGSHSLGTMNIYLFTHDGLDQSGELADPHGHP